MKLGYVITEITSIIGLHFTLRMNGPPGIYVDKPDTVSSSKISKL